MKNTICHLSHEPYSPIESMGVTLSPKIPKNPIAGEDTTTKRTSFSLSIYGALLGINANEGEEFYVYMPVNDPKTYMPNDQLYEKIPDAINTQEVWVTSDITITPLAKIIVTSCTLSQIPTFKDKHPIFNKKGTELATQTYRFKIIKEYN